MNGERLWLHLQWSPGHKKCMYGITSQSDNKRSFWPKHNQSASVCAVKLCTLLHQTWTAVSWKSNDCLTWPSIPNIFFMWTLLMWTKSTSSFAAVIINTATGVAAQEETKKWFLNNLKQGTLTSVLSNSRQSHRNMFSVAVFYLASQANTARDSPSENAHFVLLSLPTLTLLFLPLQCWEQPLSTHNRTP